MRSRKTKIRGGFTLIELLIVTTLAAIVMSGIGIILVDSQRGWQNMYNRTYNGVIADGYAARKMFDSVVRRASSKNYSLDAAGAWIEVYYYSSSSSSIVDRYARFYYDADGGQLNIEYGKLDPKETLSVNTVCENVSNCVFKATGRSAQMILTLENDTQTITVTSSAVMHNQ
jgi:prepilin-type N-terminal cleavage/methylation domain-containing protein